MEKMREEFEAWWVSRPHRKQPEKFQNGDYMAPAVLSAWEAWQASRAALVVELPNERSLSASDDPWAVRDWCKDAIEAVGVRVKA